MTTQRLRNFCFTINNPSVDDEDGLMKLEYEYLIIGKEGKGKTLHLQGYCELKKQTSFTKIKKLIPRAHIEARKGTQEQAINYCKKELDFIEWGEPRSQGHRGDLDNIREVAACQGMREVTTIGTAQQISVAQKYLTYNEDIRNYKPRVIWICGPPGCGKSRKAREICEGKDYFEKMDDTKWWDGYDKHRYVIWDDFREHDLSLTNWLRLTDRYKYQLEVKGGWRQLLAHTIIFTSVKHPSTFWKGIGEDKRQIDRRIDEIIDMTDYSDVEEGNTEASSTLCDTLWEAVVS